jgi:hypothetical protein
VSYDDWKLATPPEYDWPDGVCEDCDETHEDCERRGCGEVKMTADISDEALEALYGSIKKAIDRDALRLRLRLLVGQLTRLRALMMERP